METLYTALHEPTTLAVICILLGGVGRDIVTNLLGWPRSRRDEYRTEIEALRTEVHNLTVEVTKWRNEYYQLLDAVVRGDRAGVTKLLEDKE